MKRIVEYKTPNFEVIEIEDDVTVLEYLKQKNLKHSFSLQYVSEECFELMAKNERPSYIGSPKYIAGYTYGHDPYGEDGYLEKVRAGGLKISDGDKKIEGSFTINDDRIVYSPMEYFYEEKDSYHYFNGHTYYTTMTMQQLLAEELKKDRKLLIDMGKSFELDNFEIIQNFEEISSEEMMEYAIDDKKRKRNL